MPEVLWVLVNCPSVLEATRIGDAALAERRASCFDVFPRTLARYFWPPRAGRTEDARGALLVLETLPSHAEPLRALIRREHRDLLPFQGTLRLEDVDAAYVEWMRGELAADRAGAVSTPSDKQPPVSG